MCKTKRNAYESIDVIKEIFRRLDLTINVEKSKLVNIWDNKEGFDFLGFHHRKFPKRRKGEKVYYMLEKIPSKKAMKKMRQKFRDYISPRNKLHMDTIDFIAGLNRKIVGIRNYYLMTSMSRKWLSQIDWYISELLLIHYNKRRSQPKYRNHDKAKSLFEGRLN